MDGEDYNKNVQYINEGTYFIEGKNTLNIISSVNLTTIRKTNLYRSKHLVNLNPDTDPGQATGKVYHLRLRVECTLFCNLRNCARTYAVLVISLYELLDPTT